MSELGDRLQRLAARGSRRGADDVLDAAKREAPLGAVTIVGEDDGADRSIEDDVPFVTFDSSRRKRARFGTLVAAVGVAALVGVGALATAAIFGSGGAGSPEGAVRQLADAVSHKDPLAAVDVLVPTEVRSMRETIKDATQRAADLKIVNEASQPLAGVDLSVNDLQLSTQTLADGYAKVTFTGGVLSASTHEAALSQLVQDAMHNSSSNDKQASVQLARLASSNNLPTFVVTVRRDGRWYVSPAYTALEYAREINGGPVADFGSAKAADLGSDTPENAVSDALHALQAGNWDRLMALAPPDELPVYDYRAWIDQAAAGVHPDFTIDKLSTTATVNGDSAVVKLEASGTNGSGDNQSHWQVGGTCPSDSLFGSSVSESIAKDSAPTGAIATPVTSVGTTSGGEIIEGEGANGGGAFNVVPANAGPCLAGDLGDAVPFGLFLGDGTSNAVSSGPISIDVVREDGRWFVSPVTTVLDAVDSLIQHVDQRSVYTLLGLAYQLPPDGSITLDQPFAVPSDSSLLSSTVFAFNGTKGQNVVGEFSGSSDFDFASGEIYTADGHDVDYVQFSSPKAGEAFPTALPDTGSYRLVVSGPVAKGNTLTLWDAKDAPKGLVQSSTGGSGGDGCTSSGGPLGGSQSSCSGVTYPISGSAGSALKCSISNNAVVCAGSSLGQICPAATAPSSSNNCIPRSIAEAMTRSGGLSSGSSSSSSSNSGSYSTGTATGGYVNGSAAIVPTSTSGP